MDGQQPAALLKVPAEVRTLMLKQRLLTNPHSAPIRPAGKARSSPTCEAASNTHGDSSPTLRSHLVPSPNVARRNLHPQTGCPCLTSRKCSSVSGSRSWAIQRAHRIPAPQLACQHEWRIGGLVNTRLLIVDRVSHVMHLQGVECTRDRTEPATTANLPCHMPRLLQ